MSAETKPHPFSEHHQRHVRTTFQYIDKLLSEAEHTMVDAGSPSPFRRHDTNPAQGNARLHPPDSGSDAARDGGAQHLTTRAALRRGVGRGNQFDVLFDLAERAHTETNARLRPPFS